MSRTTWKTATPSRLTRLVNLLTCRRSEMVVIHEGPDPELEAGIGAGKTANQVVAETMYNLRKKGHVFEEDFESQYVDYVPPKTDFQVRLKKHRTAGDRLQSKFIPKFKLGRSGKAYSCDDDKNGRDSCEDLLLRHWNNCAVNDVDNVNETGSELSSIDRQEMAAKELETLLEFPEDAEQLNRLRKKASSAAQLVRGKLFTKYRNSETGAYSYNQPLKSPGAPVKRLDKAKRNSSTVRSNTSHNEPTSQFTSSKTLKHKMTMSTGTSVSQYAEHATEEEDDDKSLSQLLKSLDILDDDDDDATIETPCVTRQQHSPSLDSENQVDNQNPSKMTTVQSMKKIDPKDLKAFEAPSDDENCSASHMISPLKVEDLNQHKPDFYKTIKFSMYNSTATKRILELTDPKIILAREEAKLHLEHAKKSNQDVHLNEDTPLRSSFEVPTAVDEDLSLFSKSGVEIGKSNSQGDETMMRADEANRKKNDLLESVHKMNAGSKILERPNLI